MDTVRLNAWLNQRMAGDASANGDPPSTNLDNLLQITSMPGHHRYRAAAEFLARADADVPASLVEVYGMFCRLGSLRDIDGTTGPKRMTPGFLRDGAAVFGWTLAPHEAVAISQLDVAQLFPGEMNPFGGATDEATGDALPIDDPQDVIQ